MEISYLKSRTLYIFLLNSIKPALLQPLLLFNFALVLSHYNKIRKRNKMYENYKGRNKIAIICRQNFC